MARQRVLILRTANGARWRKVCRGTRRATGSTCSRLGHIRATSGPRLSFDYVITVCDNANESCPVFPGARRLQWSTRDPATAQGGEEQRKQAFREARDRFSERVAGANV